MIYVGLLILGLCMGSFVSALVWRTHEQESRTAKKRASSGLSIWKGRSMCPDCKHQLAPLDLIPVLSWLILRRRCRYCHKPIHWQYPLTELLTAGLFVASFVFWPEAHSTAAAQTDFGFWLIFLTGFVALALYDLRWFILPNKIVYSLLLAAIVRTLVMALIFGAGAVAVREAVWGVLIGGGIFFAIFQLSKGKWIGGGDVKLGIVLGMILGGPLMALGLLFVASLLGTLVSLPLLLSGRIDRQAHIPFGPFLLAATVIVMLFGERLINWYGGLFFL